MRIKIDKIRPGMRDPDADGETVFKGEVREVNAKFGLRDDTGSIKLNPRRGQMHSVKVGNCVRPTNAFAKGFGERAELGIGEDGKMVVPKSAGEYSG